jgi:hypothetical protein
LLEVLAYTPEGTSTMKLAYAMLKALCMMLMLAVLGIVVYFAFIHAPAWALGVGLFLGVFGLFTLICYP